MSVFRRLKQWGKKDSKDGDDKRDLSPTDVSTPETEPDEPSNTVISSSKTIELPPPTPDGSIVASTAELRVDREQTLDLAKDAKIGKHTTNEIVPGKLLKRDEQGRVHIKIVFYGPSLSGKTTALRWLFGNVRSLSKGRLVEIADELGRTTFFDFVPVTASERIVFDVFTVAGQRRHARSRITVLRDSDGIIFMADSRPEMMNENLASLEELRIALGTDRLANMPIVIALNKRDLPNALPIEYMAQMLDVESHPIFPTVATEGQNLLRMFQRVLRDALVYKVGI
ncbi:MAG: ADP-ribosylation factor-like protein [Candidatus Thorarchaeota archaeon]|nr:ADP-ribosylation factor-like protein [Candidatus Thorarchaeota archaeon]